MGTCRRGYADDHACPQPHIYSSTEVVFQLRLFDATSNEATSCPATTKWIEQSADPMRQIRYVDTAVTGFADPRHAHPKHTDPTPYTWTPLPPTMSNVGCWAVSKRRRFADTASKVCLVRLVHLRSGEHSTAGPKLISLMAHGSWHWVLDSGHRTLE